MLHKNSLVFNVLSNSTWADSLMLKLININEPVDYHATSLKLYFIR